uniref:Uncharacterized protein n=1 Tax=Arundo donax TaxID=35708 RepID=A0A0A9B437_ARUDO
MRLALEVAEEAMKQYSGQWLQMGSSTS